MSDLVERYLQCWNETDADERAKLLAEVFIETATYTDPLADVAGRDQIAATIAAVQAQFAGTTFAAGGVFDEHHHTARFTWTLGPAGAEPLVEGFDVVTLDGSGRITAVLGFLDRVPG